MPLTPGLHARDRLVAAEVPTYTSRWAVRPMTPPDVHAVADLEAASFSTPWKAATFETLLERPGAELRVLESGEGEVVGYYVLWCIQDQGELANIAIRPDLRGLGLGSQLLDDVVAVARARGVVSLFLEVRESNEAALRMYERRDFHRIGVRRDYYERPREDALVLVRRL